MKGWRVSSILVGAVVAASGFTAGPAAGQGAGLADLLAGKSAPATMKLRELGPAWQRVTITGPGADESGAGGIMGMYAAMFSMMGGPAGSPQQAHFTQGKLISVGPETYLVTYRLLSKPMDFAALMAAGQGADLPPVEKVTAESPVHLTLMNVRHIATIREIRAFDLDRELADAEKAAKETEAMRRRMMQGPLGVGAEPPVADVPDSPVRTAPAPAPAPVVRKPLATKPVPKRR